MLRVGTDCSGIEAPIQALQQLKIPFEHVFSCEKDKYALESIRANYNPKIIYEDITTRDHKKLPDIDLYVCGFPCQPFSLVGNKLGSKDQRSNIMLECIKVIKYKQPKYFILENVKNFKNVENGKLFNFLIDELSKKKNYNIYSKVLNTKNYGIPQNRERIYIIGIRKDVGDFSFPKHKKLKNLDNFIIDKTIYEKKQYTPILQKNLKKINYCKDCIVLSCNYYFPLYHISPTLTTQCSNYFLTTYKRFLTPKECLLLQGFSKNFKQVVSNHQMYKQAGNSMSVNVLKAIIKQLIQT